MRQLQEEGSFKECGECEAARGEGAFKKESGSLKRKEEVFQEDGGRARSAACCPSHGAR